MLNPELLRRDPERTRAALARRDEDAVAAFDAAVDTDRRWREVTVQVEDLRAERRQRSSGFRGKPSPELLQEMQELRDRLSHLEQQLQQVESARDDALRAVPNPPDDAVPVGRDDSENVIVRS